MKITTIVASLAFAITCAGGNAQAAIVCPAGGPTGELTFGSFDTSSLTCSVGGTFVWEIENSSEPGLFFRLLATVTSTSIVLGMETGGTGVLGDDPLWAFTLPSGQTFLSGPTEISDTFEETTATTGGGTNLVTSGPAFADFSINGGDDVYYGLDSYEARYSIQLQESVVPEPESWQLVLASLGILAVVRRRRTA